VTESYLRQKEVEGLEAATTNLRDRLLIRLLSRLGCRVSEALGLTVEDIDLVAGTVRIQHLKSRMRLACPSCGAALGKKHVFCPKCGGKVAVVVQKNMQHQRMRTLPLDMETLLMLKSYIDRGGPVTRAGRRLVFGINRHRAWQIIRDCSRRAGVPQLVNPETGRTRGISPHRLRDAFAVMAVQKDDSTDSVRMLQEWLGHANIGTTMRYRKVAGQELREWYERLWSEQEN